ncbi:MAG: dimethylarginine dimethylaminohydrolase family protein [Caldilineaceae bacterium]
MSFQPNRNQPHLMAAYGGAGWQPRSRSLAGELGNIWGACGVNSEWSLLKAVLLHRPGAELAASAEDPNAVQMVAPLDIAKAQAQHDALAQAYRDAGVTVHYVNPLATPSPNQMFCADLMFMTPEGCILARPASDVRAGEERQVAAALARIGAPILRSISGRGVFEGADAAWLSPKKVMVGRGIRTNTEAINQLRTVLGEMGVEVVYFDMPVGTMHLQGMVRFADHNLVLAWPVRLAYAAVETLRVEGYRVEFLPDVTEAIHNAAFNFVTLGPRKILLAAGNPVTQQFYESLDIECITVKVGELYKAAGSIGCLSGIVEREQV